MAVAAPYLPDACRIDQIRGGVTGDEGDVRIVALFVIRLSPDEFVKRDVVDVTARVVRRESMGQVELLSPDFDLVVDREGLDVFDDLTLNSPPVGIERLGGGTAANGLPNGVCL